MVSVVYSTPYNQSTNLEELAPSWTMAVIGYMAYALITILGYLVHVKALDTVGFIVLLLFVAFDWIRKSVKYGLRNDVVVKLSLLGLVCMTISALINLENVQIADLIKYICLFVLYIMIYSAASPSLTFSPKRKYLLLIALLVVLVSLAVRNPQTLGDGTRYSGIFPNPNSFALYCFGLLFLISKNDMKIVKWVVHLIVLISLILAGGSGALLAYAIGLVYIYFKLNRDKSFLLYFTIFMLTVGVGLALYSISGIEITAIHNTVRKIELVYDLRAQLLSGFPLDWARLAKRYDPSLLSGLWRIDHWRTILQNLFASSFVHILFGLGEGSVVSTSWLSYAKPAHCDLVRFLYEVGVIGTAIILSFFYILFRRLELQYKYIALAVFVYSLTENNFDGFLFVSLFIFILASNQENRWPSIAPIAND